MFLKVVFTECSILDFIALKILLYCLSCLIFHRKSAILILVFLYLMCLFSLSLILVNGIMIYISIVFSMSLLQLLNLY